jgi:hypothetical protein
MGGWDEETVWSRDVLMRIAALLFSLACLADRAAGLPFLHRRQALGILGNGEAVARAFLIAMATGAPVSVDAPDPSGDATRLAIRLRALALLLCAMLAWWSGLPRAAGPRPGRASHRTSGRADRRLDAPAPPAPDTS